MQARVRTGISMGKALWAEIKEDDLQGKAAQVAYHLLFSIIPLLIFLTALSSFVSQQIGVDDAMSDIQDWVTEQLPRESQDAVMGPIENTLQTTAGGLLSFGAATALWGGKNALASMMEALNIVFDVKESRPWWKRQAVAIGLTILLGLASIGGSAALLLSSAIGRDIAGRVGLGGFWNSTWRWLQFPFVAAILVLVLATVYWQGPDTNKGFKRMLPGAITSVVLWAVATFALSIYFARFAGYGTYGALGGVMAFVFFLYVMSLITLIGGEINAHGLRRATAETEPATTAIPGEQRSGAHATAPRHSATA